PARDWTGWRGVTLCRATHSRPPSCLVTVSIRQYRCRPIAPCPRSPTAKPTTAGSPPLENRRRNAQTQYDGRSAGLVVGSRSGPHPRIGVIQPSGARSLAGISQRRTAYRLVQSPQTNYIGDKPLVSLDRNRYRLISGITANCDLDRNGVR